MRAIKMTKQVQQKYIKDNASLNENKCQQWDFQILALSKPLTSHCDLGGPMAVHWKVTSLH